MIQRVKNPDLQKEKVVNSTSTIQLRIC